MANEQTHSDQTGNLHQRAEELLRKEESSAEEPLSPEQMQQMLHDLRVHQIELEMQNEELRRTQHELETSRARYFELYDLAPVGYLTLNEQGLIVEANLTAVTLLGIPRSTLLMQPLFRFFPSEDQDIYYLKRKHLFDSVMTQSWDMRMSHSAGTTFWAHLQAIPAQNGECRIMLEDITDRKQSEKSLAESQSLLEGIIDSTSDMIWSVDPVSFKLRSFNRSLSEYFLKVFNFRIEPGICARDILPGEYPRMWHNFYRRALEEGSFTTEYVNYTNTKILQLSFNPLKVNGTVFGVSVFGKDITERKHAEEALKKAHDELEMRVTERTSELAQAMEHILESEERHQLATTVAKEAIWEVDFGTGITWWNRAYAEIFNRPPDEHHHGEWWLHQIHPDDRDRVNDKFSRAVTEGPDDWTDNYRMMRADGSYAFLQDRAIIVRDGTGKAIRAVGAKQDVTEQVEAEEELLANRMRLEAALASMSDAVFISDAEGRLININDAFATFHKFRSKEECARTFAEFTETLDVYMPNGQPAPLEQWAVPRALRGETATNVEYTLRRKKTGETWVGSYSFAPIRNKDGVTIGSVVVCRDITIRKQVEKEILQLNTDLEKRVDERTAALSLANEQLRLANEEWLNTFNASSDPIFLLDTDHHITRANKALAAMAGLPVEDIIGRLCHEIIHGCDAPTTFCPQCKLLVDNQSHTEEIFLEQHGIYLLVTVSPIFDTTNKLIGSIHYSKDITAIKKAEQVLGNAKSDLERMVTERTAELALAHEQMKKVSFELVWAEEKERERIAAELHDQVGQSLLLAKMKLDALEDKLSDDSLHTYAVDVSSLIETSIHDIRSLTFRMRPPILDTAGIETALKWLCSSISNDYNIQVKFVDDDQPKPLSVELRYSLYQAVRELLLNVVKHAGTESAQLSITTENQMLVVQIADNGVGFNRPDAIMKHVHNGGYGLYNVRQRIEQMGGRFDVESAPGRGTSVTLKVPFF